MNLLPKWPQCLIYGTPVTEEQAMDIITKCDAFFTHNGNNRRFIRQVWRDCGFDVAVNDAYLGYPEEPYEHASKASKAIGALDLEFLSTRWVSSSYIGGPYGFVSPNGTIAHTKNIGKWPTVEDVYEELSKLAETFPYLDMRVILYSREELDAIAGDPLVIYYVRQGDVVMKDTVPLEDVEYCAQAYDHIHCTEFNFQETGLSPRQLKQFTDAWKPHVLATA